jgi:hypothetical protein
MLRCMRNFQTLPHSGLPSQHLSMTLSVGTPLCPYSIAYRRVLWISHPSVGGASGCFIVRCMRKPQTLNPKPETRDHGP